MTLAAAAIGWAAEPTVEVKSDGTVVFVTSVPASEASVRAVLVDTAGSLASLFPEVLSVEIQKDGTCEKVHRRTQGMFRPLDLISRRCPTERGWHEELAEVGDFEAYSAEWIVTPEASGTRIEYHARTRIDLPVPQSMVDESVKKAGLRALSNLVARLR